MRLNKSTFGFLLTVPIIILTTSVLLYPIFLGLGISLYDFSFGGPIKFIGFQNYYYAILEDYIFQKAMINHFIFLILGVSGEFILGLFFALVLKERIRGRRVIMTCFLLPVALTPVMVALTFRSFFNEEHGVMNYFLSIMGAGKIRWFSSSTGALSMLIIAYIWWKFPWDSLVLLAGLMMLPKDIFEAAEMDGATLWKKFRYITLPLLRPVITVNLVFRSAIVFKEAAFVIALTSGGPAHATEIMSTWAYTNFAQFNRIGYSSSLSTLILVISLIISLVYIKTIGRTL